MLGSRSTWLYFSTVLGRQDAIHDPQRTTVQQRAIPVNWVLISCTARYLSSVPARLRHESIATIIYHMRPENSNPKNRSRRLFHGPCNEGEYHTSSVERPVRTYLFHIHNNTESIVIHSNVRPIPAAIRRTGEQGFNVPGPAAKNTVCNQK